MMATSYKYRARLITEAALRSACDATRTVLLENAINDRNGAVPDLDDGEFRVRRITGVATYTDGGERRFDLLDRTTWGTRPTSGETIACETTCIEVEDHDETIIRCPVPALIEPPPTGDRERATVHLAHASDVTEDQLAELIDRACSGEETGLDQSPSGPTIPALRRALRALGLPGFAITARVLEKVATRHLGPLVKHSPDRFVITIDGNRIDVTIAPPQTRCES